MNARNTALPTVLQLTSMESTKYGGLEEYFVELAKACRRKGRATVFQFETPPASAAFLADLTETDAKIEIRRTTGASPRAIGNILSLLRHHRPRVLQTHFVTGYGLLAIAGAARWLGARRLVAIEHNPLDSRFTWHRRLAYRSFDHVLGVSDAVSRSLLKAGVEARKVSTHYLGLLGEREPSPNVRTRLRARLGIPDRAVTIGSLGYDTPRKGFDVLLRALKELEAPGLDVHALIVGVDPARSRLPGLAASLGLAARVHWLAPEDGAWRNLQAVDLYAQPSLSEGLPLGIMEAMAMGLPVIASGVGGVPEAVEDGVTGYLVEPGSVASLLSALGRAVSDPGQLRTMGSAGHHTYLRLFRGDRSVESLIGKYFPEG